MENRPFLPAHKIFLFSLKRPAISGLIVFLGLFIILVLVYSPALQAYYVHHDDYYLFLQRPGDCSTHPQFLAYMAYGRPIHIYGLCALRSLIKTVADANFIRLINVFSVSLLSLVTFIWLRINSIKPINSFLLCIIIFTLPAFQVNVSWITCGTFTLAALASACAALLMFKTAFKKYALERNVFYVLASISLLIIALAIYQPGALFPFALLAVPLTRANLKYWRKWRKPLLSFFSIGAVAIATYFLLYRMGLGYLRGRTDVSRAGLTLDIYGKVSWFFAEAMNNAANLWNIFPAMGITIFVCGIIFIGFLLDLFKTIRVGGEQYSRRSVLWSYFQRNFLVACLIPLSYLSNLVVQENHAAYRTLISLSPLIVLLLYWALNQIIDLFPSNRKIILASALALASVAGAFIANSNVRNYFALPSSVEFRYVESIIRQQEIREDTRIHVIIPDPGDALVSAGRRYDEFGNPTTVFRQDVYPLLIAVLYGLGRESMSGWAVSNGTAHEGIPLGKNVIVVDMGQLRKYRERMRGSIEEVLRFVDQLEYYKPTPMLVEEDYNGFNIFRYGAFYALAQDLGPVDVTLSDEKSLSEYQARGQLIVGNSVEEVKQLVSLVSAAHLDSNDVTGLTKTIATSSSDPNYGPDPKLMLDGDTQSLPWHSVQTPSYPQWIDVIFRQPVALKWVAIQAQFGDTNNQNRAPHNMIVFGGRNSEELEEIGSLTFDFDAPGTWALRRLPDPAEKYHYYRLLILDNHGSADYLTVQEIKFYGQASSVQPNPTLIEAGYQGFNLVWYNGKYYALAQALGPFDLTYTDDRTLSECQARGQCLIGNSLEEAKQQVDLWVLRSSPPELVEEGYKGFNLVRYAGKYYALALALGPFDLTQADEHALNECQARGQCFIAPSLEEVKKLVDEHK